MSQTTRASRDGTPKQIEASTSIPVRPAASPRPVTPDSHHSGSIKSYQTRPVDTESRLFDTTTPQEERREPSEEEVELPTYPYVNYDVEHWSTDEEEHEVPTEMIERNMVKGKEPDHPLRRLRKIIRNPEEADDEAISRLTTTPLVKKTTNNTYYTPSGSSFRIPQPTKRADRDEVPFGNTMEDIHFSSKHMKD